MTLVFEFSLSPKKTQRKNLELFTFKRSKAKTIFFTLIRIPDFIYFIRINNIELIIDYLRPCIKLTPIVTVGFLVFRSVVFILYF